MWRQQARTPAAGGGDGGGSDTAEACTRGNRLWVTAAPAPPSPPPHLRGPSPSDGWLGGGGRRGGGLVGEEAEFDVFLSYRVASDSGHVARLHDLLTASGLKV